MPTDILSYEQLIEQTRHVLRTYSDHRNIHVWLVRANANVFAVGLQLSMRHLHSLKPAAAPPAVGSEAPRPQAAPPPAARPPPAVALQAPQPRPEHPRMTPQPAAAVPLCGLCGSDEFRRAQELIARHTQAPARMEVDRR